MFYIQMLRQSKKLEEKIQELEIEIAALPNGMLRCSKNGKYTKWYIKKNKQLTYINSSEKEIIEKMAVKKYLSLLLEESKKCKANIDQYILNYEKTINKSQALLNQDSPYIKYLSNRFITLSEEQRKWKEEEYEKSNKYPEKLIYKSNYTGNIVRSKSELMIDTALYMKKIPFRYECALLLGDKIFYPDFTILNPRDNKVIYWEHMGRMDDLEYVKRSLSKIYMFSKNGIIQPNNLIMTYETNDNPLTPEVIEHMIQMYLL